MSARVAVIVFPGTNSEDETVRALRAVGCEAEAVHWSRSLADVRAFDAYVLPGGFAYEDRVRAGAVAAHDAVMDVVIEAAAAGKFVLGICNGAQILLEAGLVPGTGAPRVPTAAFAPNAGGRFHSVHVHIRLAVAPGRIAALERLGAEVVIPAWASHGEGRLAASDDALAALERDGHAAFVYCDAQGTTVPSPNGSPHSIAGLVNARGNVVAIMPHPERDAWTYMHREGDAARVGAQGDTAAMLGASGGIVFFAAFAAALGVVR